MYQSPEDLKRLAEDRQAVLQAFEATEQELTAARARIAELERESQRRVVSEAVASALGMYDLVPAGAEQLRQLVEPDVALVKGLGGRDVVVGPDFQPIESHIANVLRQPAFGHFIRPKESPAPAVAEGSAGSGALTDALGAFVTQPGDYVTARLGGLNCRHVVSGGLDERPAAPPAPTQVPVQEPLHLPGETLGAALVRRATAPQPERGDPRLDPSQPLSLGARSLTRK